MTATHELVVPRSIPMTLPIPISCCERSHAGPDDRPVVAPARLRSDLDLDLAQLGLLGLGHADLEDAVPILSLDAVALHRSTERERALEDAGRPLHAVIAL